MMDKERYKEVRIGPKNIYIPSNWEHKKLNSICETYSGGTPLRSKDKYFNGDIPWVKSGELNRNIISNTEERISTKGLNNSNAKWVPSKSVLIAMYGATAGKVGYLEIKATTNQAILAVLPNNNTNVKYLYYILSKQMKNLVSQRQQGTGQQNLSKKLINDMEVILPPKNEQKKIASILSQVDKAIEKTDEVIEETKQLKKGLMQELLTKGIGHDEFKDSELGSIPIKWDIVIISEVTKINPKYDVPTKDKYLYLEMDSVNEDSPRVDGFEKRKKENCTNVKFKNGDVLFARITPSTENGKTALINDIKEEIAYGSTELIVLSPKEEKILSEYIYYLIKWDKIRNFAISMMEGSTGGQRVPREVFDSVIKIPLPPIEEQKKIIEILTKTDNKIQKEQEYKKELETLKKGLMQKLLTGEVRVNIDNEEV